MPLLRRVLQFKIVVTVIAWAMPFLFLPKDLFVHFIGFSPEPLFLVRLLGWSYLALVVGYTYGLKQANEGVAPWGVIYMGLVSNGGAALIVGWQILFDEAAHLTGIPTILLSASFAALLAITLGLAFSAMKLRVQS